jgi:hypothetical protein
MAIVIEPLRGSMDFLYFPRVLPAVIIVEPLRGSVLVPLFFSPRIASAVTIVEPLRGSPLTMWAAAKRLNFHLPEF